mgnify:CR=1 FL=1
MVRQTHEQDMQLMVEIAKAVSYNSDVLIMDEPTSALTDKEVDDVHGRVVTAVEERFSAKQRG